MRCVAICSVFLVTDQVGKLHFHERNSHAFVFGNEIEITECRGLTSQSYDLLSAIALNREASASQMCS